MTLAEIRAAIAAATERMTAAGAAINEARADITPEQLDALVAEFNEVRSEVSSLREQEAAEVVREEARSAARLIADITPAADTAEDRGRETTGSVRVVSEPRTYSVANPQAPSFFRDAAAGLAGRASGEQLARITRSRQEDEVEARERRDAHTIAATSPNLGSNFVIPQYLINEWVNLNPNWGRPVADLVRNLPLDPSVNSIIIPRVTTPAMTFGVQAAELDEVAETELNTDDITIPVRTVGAQATSSFQLLDRAQVPGGFDALIIGELVVGYATEIDRQVVKGTGSSGEMLGLLNTSGVQTITFTSASPTLALYYQKLILAQDAVLNAYGTPATAVVAASRRNTWAVGQTDADGRPYIPWAGAPSNPVGSNPAVARGLNPSFYLAGLPNYSDVHIPTNQGVGTNQDVAIVGAFQEAILWEAAGGMPRFLRLDQVKGRNLGTVIVGYSYAAFSAERRPAAFAKISGTGMIPTL